MAKNQEMWDYVPEIPINDKSDFVYSFNADLGGIEVTDYIGKGQRINIPDTLGGKPVEYVELRSCSKELEEVIMPSTVKNYNLPYSVKYFNIPSGSYLSAMEYIGMGYGNTMKDKFVNLTGKMPNLAEAVYVEPDSDLKIFMSCRFAENLRKINIPDTVTKFGPETFNGCKSLQWIIIPEGVKEVTDHAFFECECLTEVSIPNSVKVIGEGAFSGCISLNRVNIPDGVTEISENLFVNCKHKSVI